MDAINLRIVDGRIRLLIPHRSGLERLDPARQRVNALCHPPHAGADLIDTP